MLELLGLRAAPLEFDDKLFDCLFKSRERSLRSYIGMRFNDTNT